MKLATVLFTEALRFDPKHREGRKLKSALQFGRQMSNLDLNQLEQAILEGAKVGREL